VEERPKPSSHSGALQFTGLMNIGAYSRAARVCL
jgi:hypothetical protein